MRENKQNRTAHAQFYSQIYEPDHLYINVSVEVIEGSRCVQRWRRVNMYRYLRSTWKHRPFGAMVCAGAQWQRAWPSYEVLAYLSSQWPSPYRRRRQRAACWASPWSPSPKWYTGSSHQCYRRSSLSPPPADPATFWTCYPPILHVLHKNRMQETLLRKKGMNYLSVSKRWSEDIVPRFDILAVCVSPPGGARFYLKVIGELGFWRS